MIFGRNGPLTINIIQTAHEKFRVKFNSFDENTLPLHTRGMWNDELASLAYCAPSMT